MLCCSRLGDGKVIWPAKVLPQQFPTIVKKISCHRLVVLEPFFACLFGCAHVYCLSVHDAVYAIYLWHELTDTFHTGLTWCMVTWSIFGKNMLVKQF